MDKNDQGILNKREENKKIFILVVSILVVILICYFVVTFFNNRTIASKNNINTIVQNSETAVLYIWNSDTKKCKDCKKIKQHLDKQKINYIDYDVKNYSKSKYEKILTTLSINPPDFNYPAVIYVKDGVMYSNIINISDTKVVDTFIDEYHLQDVK